MYVHQEYPILYVNILDKFFTIFSNPDTTNKPFDRQYEIKVQI